MEAVDKVEDKSDKNHEHNDGKHNLDLRMKSINADRGNVIREYSKEGLLRNYDIRVNRLLNMTRLERNHDRVRSIVSWPWIINTLLN